MVQENDKEEPHRLPINGILDLHTFQPSDLGTLIDDYIEACLDKGIYEVRIIHGKGTGALRRSVHHLLEKNPHVKSFGTPADKSNWGATTATLEQQ